MQKSRFWPKLLPVRARTHLMPCIQPRLFQWLISLQWMSKKLWNLGVLCIILPCFKWESIRFFWLLEKCLDTKPEDVDIILTLKHSTITLHWNIQLQPNLVGELCDDDKSASWKKIQFVIEFSWILKQIFLPSVHHKKIRKILMQGDSALSVKIEKETIGYCVLISQAYYLNALG